MYRTALYEKNKIHPNGFEFERNYHTIDELIDDWGLDGEIANTLKILMQPPYNLNEFERSLTIEVGRHHEQEARPLNGVLKITKLHAINPKF